MKRKIIAELLDDDLGTPEEVASSLIDLRHINNWFGGTATTTKLLRRIAVEVGQQELSMLEMGAGLGDVPLGAKRALAKDGISLQITLLDRVWSHLPKNGVVSVSGDAMQLPFCDDAFDVVGCTLFAHHFEPHELLELVGEALRVCRRAVLVNDVIRSRIHLALTYAGLPLFRSRMTWHDAPASVRRAYTGDEMSVNPCQIASPTAGDHPALPLPDGDSAVEMSRTEFDLAVVGGGPAGAAAAITAARFGARVVLFEAGELPRQKVCGEFVSAESLEVLRDLLRDVPEAVSLLQLSPLINRTRLFLAGRVVMARVSPPALSIPRLALDSLLWRAALQAGVEAHSSCEVRAVRGDGPFLLETLRAGSPRQGGDRRCRAVVEVQAPHRHSQRAQVDRLEGALSRA